MRQDYEGAPYYLHEIIQHPYAPVEGWGKEAFERLMGAMKEAGNEVRMVWDMSQKTSFWVCLRYPLPCARLDAILGQKAPFEKIGDTVKNSEIMEPGKRGDSHE